MFFPSVAFRCLINGRSARYLSLKFKTGASTVRSIIVGLMACSCSVLIIFAKQGGMEEHCG